MIIAGGSTDGSSGGAGRLASSPDGTSGSWTLLTTPIDGHVNTSYYGVVSNETRWVAGGFWTGTLAGTPNITTNRFITSDDATTWTIRSSPLDSNSWSLRGLVYAPELGLFVAACGGPTNAAVILTSADGASWTQQTIPSIGPLLCIGWSGSLFVVGSSSGGIATSTDATTWTQRTGQPIDYFGGVTWASSLSLWIGVGHTPPFNNRHFFTSSDGITWTERSTSVNGSGVTFAVGWNGSMLVAIGGTGSTLHLLTSTDGTSWTARTHAFTGTIASSEGAVLWTGSRWIASFLPSGTTSTGVITSTDGINWAADTTGLTAGAASLGLGSPYYVSSADTSTGVEGLPEFVRDPDTIDRIVVVESVSDRLFSTQDTATSVEAIASRMLSSNQTATVADYAQITPHKIARREAVIVMDRR